MSRNFMMAGKTSIESFIIFLIFLNVVQYNDCKCFIKDTIDYKLEQNTDHRLFWIWSLF